MKCPDSIEELEEIENMLPLCKITLLEQVTARVNVGAAKSFREAERQIANETGKSEGVIHSAVSRAKKENLVAPLPEGESQTESNSQGWTPPWTGQCESYTPEEYIKSVTAVLGAIDLDPSSCEEANKIVAAKKIYTKDDDGLSRDWFGRVFLNPPYGQPEMTNFVNKLIQEYTSGKVKEAILLTNNSTETRWFQAVSKFSIICFPSTRIRFLVNDRPTQPTTGQAFFYFGEDEKKFIQEFSRHGIIARVKR